MKDVHIIALHLGCGGIEKAVCSIANILAERYRVEIISVYDLPEAPAFPLDSRVRVRYLLKEVPNRAEWHAAMQAKAPGAIVRESVKSVRILHDKRSGVINAIKDIYDGVIITTRHEDNMLLSKYGRSGVLKIAQIHCDHRFEKSFVDGFKKNYGGIDVLTMLTPGLRDEVQDMMRWENDHTKVVYIPNFLEHFPEDVPVGGREKTVLAVGRLDKVKRFDLLIRQFAELHGGAEGWTLKIAGDGQERGSVEALIAELGAQDYVRLLGRLTPEQVESEMLRAGIYAMSSSSEGFGFVLIEAQSCGLPAVAYDVRVGPSLIVHDGADGYLIPDGDHAAFRRRMLDLMESEELRESMAENALEAAKQFSWENVSKMWYSLIGD